MTAIVAVVPDLMAFARLEAGARAAGVDLTRSSLQRLSATESDLVVVDLDALGTDGLAQLIAATGGRPVVGFFSHVDESVGTAARAAGIEAVPRGRFWRELSSFLGRV